MILNIISNFFFLDPSAKPRSLTWRGQASRTPRYLDIKLESNRDIRETMASAPKEKPKTPSDDIFDDFPPIVEDIRVKEKRQREMQQKEKASPVITLNPVITDIRFQQASSKTSNSSASNSKSTSKRSNSQTRGFAPQFNSAKSKAPNQNPKTQYYNTGRSRTYLSDRESRNRDCRESSSQYSSPVTFGYQYPPAEQQSKRTFKKLPRVEKNTDKESKLNPSEKTS